MTEVETLKNTLAEAQKRAAKEQAAREKHEARVGEVQQQLQCAIERFESLERDCKVQESELAKAHQSAQDARAEAQNALQEIQAAKKIAAGKYFTMQSKYVEETFLVLIRIWVFQGRLRICRAVYQTLRSSSEPEKGITPRSCSGRSMLCQNIRCPLSIN